MITFWVDRSGIFGPTEYLESRGKALADRITVQPYDWDRDQLEVAPGTQIFSAIDQLTEPELEGVTALRRQLEQRAPGILMLNNPARCLQRRDLLTTLADRGINRFRAYPADQASSLTRFPVFVRGIRDHGGSRTGLLHSRREVGTAIRALRLRGRALSDLLIVEFCDTSDAAGLFRKYGAYRIGNAIVPVHVMRGRHWIVKADGAERTRDSLEEDRRFVEENPHESWLREIFSLAGVDYGRIDYGVLGDVPQVWEINLNPTLTGRIGKPRPQLAPGLAELRESTRTLAHTRLREAFVALDRTTPALPVNLRLDPVLRRAIARAILKRRRRARLVQLLERTYESPFGVPFRPALRRVFPRR